MDSNLVDHETFFNRLTKLFEGNHEMGSIWLTHKRFTYDGEDTVMKGEDSDTQEYPCLVRATDGVVKFSTKVESSELFKFQNHYGTLLKSSMTTLRKRDKKREKIRSEEAAKRKKKMTEPVILEGPKRGSGRRQRQRKLKALVKQEESQKRFQAREEERKKAENDV